LDCSSIKAVRDLSSDRRETGRFLSLSAKGLFSSEFDTHAETPMHS